MIIKKKKLYENKFYLEEQYIKNKKSMQIISEEIGCSIDTVYRWLLRHGIPVRSKSEALKGKITWSTGLTKETDPRLMKISMDAKQRYIDHPEIIDIQSKKMKLKWEDVDWRNEMISKLNIAAQRSDVVEKRRINGIKFSKNFEAHEKISKSVLKLWEDPEWRARNIASIRTPEIRYARSVRMTNMWKDPEKRKFVSEKISKTIGSIEYQEKVCYDFSRRPNSIEQLLFNYLIIYQGWEYSGDGSFWVNLENGHMKNPDFINEHESKVIEVFGDYWHDESEVKPLIAAYQRVCLDCFIIWEHEMKNMESLHENKALEDFLATEAYFIDNYDEWHER